MKQNLLKTWLVMLCMLVGIGSAWADDVVYKTALFGSSYNSKAVSSYTGTFSATNNEFTVDLANFNNNNNGWDYVKTGNKSNASVGTITTNAAIDKAVTKVVVTIDAITASSVNSITLYSGASASACTTSEGTFSASTGAQTVTISSPSADKFYKISFDCDKGGSNGLVTVSKVQYYVSDGGASAPKYSVNIAGGITHGSVSADPTQAEADATVSLTATPDAGYMLGSWTVTNATTSESITVKDDQFTMPAADVNVSATFTTIPEKTIAEFIASEGGTCYLTGIVSNIANTKYGNFDLTDESGTIYVYGCLTPAGVAQQFSTLDIVEGDKIKVLANEYLLYNETDEAKNVIFVEEIEIPKAKYAVTILEPENGTLVVKEGETTLTSGDEVEEGKVITVECTPADGYRYQNWQYKEDGNWITNTSTMTRTVTQAISIRANFEAIPTYTVAWSVNGTIVKSDDLKEGATVTAPADPEAINGKVFTGWVTTESVAADATPAYVTPATTATADVTYYAVFATRDGSAEASLTKLNGGSTLNEGDNIVVVAKSGDNYYVMYQETVSASYVNYSALDHAPVLADVKDDSKMSWTLTASNSKWILGDATNGYLQNSNNNLYANTDASTPVTIAWNNTESKFSIKNDTRWIACRADLTGDNQYKYRGAGNQGTPTANSIAYFDIYRLSSSSVTYSDFTTTVAAPVAKTIDFYAAGTDGYYTTFSNDKAVTIPEMVEIGEEVAQLTVYTVMADGNELLLVDQTSYDGTWYLSENEGYLIKAEYTGDVTYTGEKAISVEYTELDYNLNGQDAENFLRPASEAKTGDNKYYMLAYSDNTWNPASLGFYWGAADGAAFTSRANSAYLALPKGTSAKGFSFADASTTGIKNVNNVSSRNVAYNLAGQRVNANTKGIVIMNGKKYLNK